jgi:hypothetical protein
MNKSQIFIQFRETAKIETIITYITVNELKRANNIDTYDDINTFNEKIKKYIAIKSQQFIKYHNLTLDVKECQINSIQNMPRYLFTTIYTKTNTNHPYLLFFNLDDIYLTFLIPFGGNYKQSDINIYLPAIEESNKIECIAILYLLGQTIYIRKMGIVDSRQFSLINCDNITNCIKKMHDIDKMSVSSAEKQTLKQKYNEYYLYKAIEFIKYYFYLLDNKHFDEALLFLRGGDTEHFGKQRLNTFFKNTKTIIGHLEIFIILYKLYNEAKSRVN